MIFLFQRKFTFLMLALASWWCAPVIAQDNIDTLQEYLPSGCHHAGQYRQEKTLAGLEQALITEGSFVYSCELGLIWHTATPVTETIIYKITAEHFLLSEDNILNPLDGRVHQALGTLLNHLVGGDTVYLQRHFQITVADNALRLNPKQKRLKKFIQYIEIIPQDQNVKITLRHNPDEATQILITERRVFEAFDMERCKILLPEKAFACGALFL